MRYLSLFSGIEAASVAWAPLGWECAAVAEVEPFPCAVLAQHYPGVPNLGDVTKITEADIRALGHIDVVVFGSPCQDLSVAGQRKGLINEHGDITRSGLFFTAIDIFHWSGARFAVWENVPGAFSSGKGRDFASVVSFMAGLDGVDVPPNGWGTEGAALGDNGLLEWSTLDAQWFGVAQRRRRVFAVLDTGDWAGRPPILLEPESLRGDTAPRREAGESITHDIAPCIGAALKHSDDLAFTLTQPSPSGGGHPQAVAYPINTQIALRHEALGRNTGFGIAEDGAPGFTLQAGHGHAVAYAFQPRIARNGRGDMGDVVRALNAQSGETGKGDAAPCVAFNWNAQAAQLPSAGGRGTEVNDGLTCSQQAAVATSIQVRRLTPTECERLQGFPDGHSAITYRNNPACDGPRYKALGNSMAVPVMRHIGIKIMEAVWY